MIRVSTAAITIRIPRMDVLRKVLHAVQMGIVQKVSMAMVTMVAAITHGVPAHKPTIRR